ncbi:MAG TPA: bifunctional aldolase/short-chain dehydrogenase [Chitinivibrionales bacterium]
MENKWSDSSLEQNRHEFASRFHDPEASQLVYLTRLIGSEPDLALHGGGNTSYKTSLQSIIGEPVSALIVKASGQSMNTIGPDGFTMLDLNYLLKLQALNKLSDEDMADQFRMHMLQSSPFLPSIETLLHAFIPARFIVHTHPTPILALSNREDGRTMLLDCQADISILPYVKVGFDLAAAAAKAHACAKAASGLVIMHHGLVTWGDSAQNAYDKTIDVVTKAQRLLQRLKTTTITAQTFVSVSDAAQRYRAVAPVIRGALTPETSPTQTPRKRIILKPLITDGVLSLLGSHQGKNIALSAPLTPDYLIRTKALPLWIDSTLPVEEAKLRALITKEIAAYGERYAAYMRRAGVDPAAWTGDLLPRVLLLPGIGALCAAGSNAEACVVRDITEQALSVKQLIHETSGVYLPLDEAHLADMEFRSFQRAKLGGAGADALQGAIVVVTGAAGAIGAGICQGLLAAGSHVVATDLAGDALTALARELSEYYPGRIIAQPMDVTDPVSVASCFSHVCGYWGGVDGVVVNAGIAHVSTLETMDLEVFRKLERVNIDGTLLVIREAARLFRAQNRGGDIVLISTKNVFAPGAKFGAYSATKAAAHQIARIASLELADLDVRVNMVAPDAVFSHGNKKSGLWAAVGPDRMRARGLDEAGLEEYYRSRNLLKATITAGHVANAVLFFLTRQTPTTGATIPVDGGLPDATPR